MSLPRALRPLGVRDYRLVFCGSGLSAIGTWMHRVAVDWLIYQQTDSAAWVGLVTFAQFVPLAILGPFGGVLADRLDRRAVLMAGQAFMMAGATTLAVLQFQGTATPVVLVLVSLGLGVGFAFVGPTWQSTIPHLVPRELLTSGIALNSAKMSIARIAGPAAGGLLLAAIGAGGVFTINALSYIAVILALWRLRLPPAPARAPERVHRQLGAGIRYAVADRGILWLVVGVMLVSFMAAPLVTLLPVYARDVLGGNASTLGMLTGCLGAGSLIGSFVLGQVGDEFPPATLVGGSVLALSAATASVAAAPGIALTGAAVIATGLFRLGSIAASNTRLQARSDDAYRGRVMSLFMLGFGAAYPVGALVIGGAAQTWGARPVTLWMAAGIALTGWLLHYKLGRHGAIAVPSGVAPTSSRPCRPERQRAATAGTPRG